jgi:uncharacterized small protein (DUF1192 family)
MIVFSKTNVFSFSSQEFDRPVNKTNRSFEFEKLKKKTENQKIKSVDRTMMETHCESIHHLLNHLNGLFTKSYNPVQQMIGTEINPLRFQFSQQLIEIISLVSELLVKANHIKEDQKQKGTQIVTCVQELKQTIVRQQDEIQKLKVEKQKELKTTSSMAVQTQVILYISFR